MVTKRCSLHTQKALSTYLAGTQVTHATSLEINCATLFVFNITLIFAAVLTLSATHALAMTKAEYSADKTRISADYRVNQAVCASMTGNTKDDAKTNCVTAAKAAFGKI